MHMFSVLSSVEVQDPLDMALTEVPPGRRPTKDSPRKESAVLQHRQQLKTRMKYHKLDDPKVPHAKQSQCQQELDQVLERISKIPFQDNRSPLEDLYSLHIPNCDKRGQYNLKQCKMSVNGYRGECWCVNPHTGQAMDTSPLIRGDPNCNQYLDGLEDPSVDPES
ncbi:hypothetical protein DNTS_035765 [Danionella cerebrum]|uniref:Thyroglobulin type-1 domain-containing protein n=1 Tax=Danionella cerebrum TaxID=2873325 RepID=A0A553MXE2_9TELE|nr:hypothetical protein DNTS_035765 [Danionella translucida]